MVDWEIALFLMQARLAQEKRRKLLEEAVDVIAEARQTLGQSLDLLKRADLNAILSPSPDLEI